MSYSGSYMREEHDGIKDDEVFEEDESGDHEGHARSRNDHVILLVDARKNMLETMNEYGEVSRSILSYHNRF